MGHTLVHILREYQHGYQPAFGACYVNPPLGNCIAHETTTNANVRTLPSHFGESWCQGGTRKDESFEHWYNRQLCHYTEKGNAHLIKEVVPTDDTSWWWKTQAHSQFPERGLGVQFWHRAPHLEDRGSACLWV